MSLCFIIVDHDSSENMSYPYLGDLVYALSGYRLPLPVAMFGLFVAFGVLAGAERLLIEQIRVNVRFHVHGLSFTQAELIAVLFLLLGAAGMLLLSRPAPVTAPAAPRATGSVGRD